MRQRYSENSEIGMPKILKEKFYFVNSRGNPEKSVKFFLEVSIYGGCG